jgi:hypothetical protein
MLGLDINAATRTLTLHSPYLPPRAGAVSIRNMRIGDGMADFILRHKHGAVTVVVTNSRAGAKVIMA